MQEWSILGDGVQAAFSFLHQALLIVPSTENLRVARRSLFAIALACAVAGLGFVALPSVGPQLHHAIRNLQAARPDWVAVAAVCFLSAALASAAAWRSALCASAGRIGIVDATARYAVGSLVNTFVPARMGDVVRVGLLSHAFERSGRVLTTTGVLAFIGVARAAALALLLLPAAALGVLPVRMLQLTGVLVVVGLTISLWARRRVEGLVARLLDAFRLIGRSPAATARVVGWLLLSSAARLGAAAAAAAALGVSNPVAAAAIIVAALELSGMVPLTPGNLGITSGVVALALTAQGVNATTALSVGIGFHAIETMVGISFGLAGTVKLASLAPPRARRIATVALVLAAFVAVAAVLGVFLDVS
jgi:uncharacterized membrane protein YbhN (UPF0104 family)